MAGTTTRLPVLESEFSVAAVRVLSPLAPLCWPESLRALPLRTPARLWWEQERWS